MRQLRLTVWNTSVLVALWFDSYFVILILIFVSSRDHESWQRVSCRPLLKNKPLRSRSGCQELSLLECQDGGQLRVGSNSQFASFHSQAVTTLDLSYSMNRKYAICKKLKAYIHMFVFVLLYNIRHSPGIGHRL